MATLRDIKQRIGAAQSTAKIMQAMQMVAASKLRRAQDGIQNARPYFKKMNEILKNIVDTVSEDYSHPLIRKSEDVNNIVVIVIAGDKGLCGSFNNNLFKYAQTKINEELRPQYPNANIEVIPVGKKTCAFFAKQDIPVVKEFSGVFHNLNVESARAVISLVKPRFIAGELDRVFVVNNDFINLITQAPVMRLLLPIGNENITLDITSGKKSVKSDVSKVEKKYLDAEYIFEPNKEELLNAMLPMNLEMQLWRALLESNAAENAARMMAMENATNNANELISQLQLLYNKARQTAITTEMLEIVSGAEALSN